MPPMGDITVDLPKHVTLVTQRRPGRIQPSSVGSHREQGILRHEPQVRRRYYDKGQSVLERRIDHMEYT